MYSKSSSVTPLVKLELIEQAESRNRSRAETNLILSPNSAWVEEEPEATSTSLCNLLHTYVYFAPVHKKHNKAASIFSSKVVYTVDKDLLDNFSPDHIVLRLENAKIELVRFDHPVQFISIV